MKPDMLLLLSLCFGHREMHISGTSVKPLEDTPQRFSCKIGNEMRLKMQPWGTLQMHHWQKRKQVFVLLFKFKKKKNEKKQQQINKLASRCSPVAVQGRDLSPEMLFMNRRRPAGVCARVCCYLIYHDLPFGPSFLKKK